jgi:hypothetical protein
VINSCTRIIKGLYRVRRRKGESVNISILVIAGIKIFTIIGYKDV